MPTAAGHFVGWSGGSTICGVDEVMFLYDEVYEQQQYLQHGIELHQGDTVVDVGANIGLFSMMAAERVGPTGCVVSLEPSPLTAAALTFNLNQHADWWQQHHNKQVARSLVVPVAMTDDATCSQAQFTVYSRAPGWSTLVRDDAEVLSNMQSYLQSLLTEKAAAQHQQHHTGATSPAAVTSVSRGWSGPQQLLVWYAKQLGRTAALKPAVDVLASLYVRLVMLSGAETITVPTATVSCIIQQEQLTCVNLLKVDVERAELQVLRGIQQQHWPLIQQITMEVHDINNRLSEIVALLGCQGFRHVRAEQLGHLQGTGLYNLYATR